MGRPQLNKFEVLGWVVYHPLIDLIDEEKDHEQVSERKNTCR